MRRDSGGQQGTVCHQRTCGGGSRFAPRQAPAQSCDQFQSSLQQLLPWLGEVGGWYRATVEQSERVEGRVGGRGLTSAGGAVAYVAGLTGAQVASDGVGANGVLVTGALAAGTLVTL